MPLDEARVARQLGRPPRPFRRVVARCAAGWPLAVEQPSRDPDGAPFSTTFWLTCPGLVRAIARLEDAGGVAELAARVAADPAVAEQFADGRRRQIALRPVLGALGIGGTRDARSVKCLHAHAAFALGAPPYPPGAEAIARAGGIPSPCCMASDDAATSAGGAGLSGVRQQAAVAAG